MARHGGHALIIEDEAIIAMEVEMLLSDMGYETFDFALSPAEAVALAKHRRPDLVTADYQIQGGTGVDAVEGLFAAVGEVPVVFVTGNLNMVPQAFAERRVGKPINARDLGLACERAIHG